MPDQLIPDFRCHLFDNQKFKIPKIMALQKPQDDYDWNKEFVKVVPSFDEEQAIEKGAMMQIMD